MSFRALGAAARQARATAWQRDDVVIEAALESVASKAMVKAPGLTAIDTQFWHRVRLHQVNCWHVTDSRFRCAHEDCRETDNSTGHLLWRCPAAQALWNKIGKSWGAFDATDLRPAIFGWTAPTSKYDWTAAIGMDQGPRTQPQEYVEDRLHHWLEHAWILVVTCAARRLWSSQLELSSAEPKGRVANGFATWIYATWMQRLQATLPSDVDLDARHDYRIQRGLVRWFG